ncbi:allantoicase [Synchytrium microbalum]|uniref:Allantoicase n=1 Tax=Synchytrium microbalum TaxID=1806994 RepID=A0A507C7H4_9FUNG|nr:allantoicase [Synchytrium microbalum]TPX35451.1 allantoicase [Synchytrium microbalum]
MEASVANLPDLASAALGGQVLFCTDDFFAVGENMILSSEPKWDQNLYTAHGKWMDGWETRRKRMAGHDWCIIQLGISGIIKGVEADTAFFTGNQAPKISIQAACLETDAVKLPRRRSEMGTAATPSEIAAAEALHSEKWEEILSIVDLKPGYPETRKNTFAIDSNKRWTHIRLNLYPDGGVARLRVHGQVARDWSKVSKTETIDLIAVANGGEGVACSNQHYGKPSNLNLPSRSAGMFDGWETARDPSRPGVFKVGPDGYLISPNYEWAVMKLGHVGNVHQVQVDTEHFKGNFPESCHVQGTDFTGDVAAFQESTAKTSSRKRKHDEPVWFDLVPRSRLSANLLHIFDAQNMNKKVTYVRITIFPDGGVSRLRVMGNIA